MLCGAVCNLLYFSRLLSVVRYLVLRVAGELWLAGKGEGLAGGEVLDAVAGKARPSWRGWARDGCHCVSRVPRALFSGLLGARLGVHWQFGDY